MRFRLDLLLFTIALLFSPVFSDLVFSKVDRRIDLKSQIVRTISTIKVENAGTDTVAEVLLAFPDRQAKNLAYLTATLVEGKGKLEVQKDNLPIEVVHPEGMPPALSIYAVSLPYGGLGTGESLTWDVLAVFTHALQPFPEEITHADTQPLFFKDSAHFLTPYLVKVQSLSIKLPEARLESYTKLENTEAHGSEIKYGPYENIPSFAYSPIAIHFESNQPFAVAEELVREVEISHWGNVQVTEHYKLVHAGAGSWGEFSRLEYQARPDIRGSSAFKHLIAELPPRAHSVYYKDDIGNVSTSQLWDDSKKTELLIEARYPVFGDWGTAFTIGYGLPLQDFLFESEGKRYLNFTFGCPMNEVVVEILIVKVVLPEGSGDISVSTPFPVKQWQETKLSHLDLAGRPVVVLEKDNVVPEHNQHFQVYYKFSRFSMLREPLMLILGFFILFVTCIVYMHADMFISKSSAAYLAKQQWDEVVATIEQVENIINQRLIVYDKLEASVGDLYRTGDVQACKATLKEADGLLKELAKELKLLLSFLQTCPQATQILPKVERLVTKFGESQDKVMTKFSTVLDAYEKEYGGREIENRVASQQEKITTSEAGGR